MHVDWDAVMDASQFVVLEFFGLFFSVEHRQD
jgi:hypothetical protein